MRSPLCDLRGPFRQRAHHTTEEEGQRQSMRERKQNNMTRPSSPSSVPSLRSSLFLSLSALLFLCCCSPLPLLSLPLTGAMAQSLPSNSSVSANSSDSTNSSSSSTGAAAELPDLPFTRPPTVFTAYKDATLSLNWASAVAPIISTSVNGTLRSLACDLQETGLDIITLAFATGECGEEHWSWADGDNFAPKNMAMLVAANISYVISTGGAAGAFTCATDEGFDKFLSHWNSSYLVGVDFDIEGSQSSGEIEHLLLRAKNAHRKYPQLRFRVTVATLAASLPGQTVARSLGNESIPSLGRVGTAVLNGIAHVWDWSVTWPSYLSINLMTMDYGTLPTTHLCLMVDGRCEIAESAIQAVYNLRDVFGVPMEFIEITVMSAIQQHTQQRQQRQRRQQRRQQHHTLSTPGNDNALIVCGV